MFFLLIKRVVILLLFVFYNRLDDLVVSAPFHLWTAVGENINMGGAVYVYLNGLQVSVDCCISYSDKNKHSLISESVHDTK